MSKSRIAQRVRLFALAAGAALLAALLLPRGADAGSYVVTQCSRHAPSPGEASWERNSDHYASRARCGPGEGLQVHHRAERSAPGRFGAWVWRAPTGTAFTSMQANASLTNQGGHHAELRAWTADGSTSWGDEHDDFGVHRLAGEYRQFAALLRCSVPGPDGHCGRADDDAAHAYVKGVFATLEDRAAPTLSIAGGSLLSGPVVRGVRSLAFSAVDRGAGIRSVAIHANGARLAADERNCSLADGFATALSPCPVSTSELSAIDTAGPAFRLGPDNVVTPCAADLALDGRANVDCVSLRVWVDNACPGSATPAASLEAGFPADEDGGALRTTARVTSTQRARVAGRVLGTGGAPVAGATVCVLTRERVAAAPVVLATVATSRADGGFRAELAPGPNREVFVHQAYDNRIVARHGLALSSRVRPTLRVRPQHPRNGRRLRFSGALPGPACEDRVVKLQARISKHRWQVFRTDRAGGRCEFEARYRLRATGRDTRYRFRAYVPPQAGYPYVPGYSRVVAKRVEGGRR